ncbi:MAG: bifunctional 4-hydroxy-2-oxoglutarate aldolase/2-dehydro-3-deoxy-phosphogluconate aldolase [Salinibacterium sp.]|nr:bifunctional 4-hydroxy-2-oxoglutarate aldolase/2-dehydro-3-deoxy-phosphogluconate aldolase [Salinibacterium sp.]
MSAVLDAIRAQGVVGIVRASAPNEAARHVAILMGAGLRVIEVSLVTPGALDVIRASVARAPDGVYIGVGTVVTPNEVSLAAAAGATFVVSPVIREGVIKASLDAGLDTVPGVATPTEALQAIEWGATMIKLFPASLWSPAVLREVLTALPSLEVVPTGGVTLESAPEWIRAGAMALGIGSTLTRASDPEAVAQELLGAITSARS